MAKLIACPTCSHQVSSAALKCPSCGEKLGRSLEDSFKMGCLWVSILVVVVGGFISSFNTEKGINHETFKEDLKGKAMQEIKRFSRAGEVQVWTVKEVEEGKFLVEGMVVRANDPIPCKAAFNGFNLLWIQIESDPPEKEGFKPLWAR